MNYGPHPCNKHNKHCNARKNGVVALQLQEGPAHSVSIVNDKTSLWGLFTSQQARGNPVGKRRACSKEGGIAIGKAHLCSLSTALLQSGWYTKDYKAQINNFCLLCLEKLFIPCFQLIWNESCSILQSFAICFSRIAYLSHVSALMKNSYSLIRRHFIISTKLITQQFECMLLTSNNTIYQAFSLRDVCVVHYLFLFLFSLESSQVLVYSRIYLFIYF